MDAMVALLLVQDGVGNGAIYALLALSLVLVFAVTRVIFVPQGEFVAFGALTLSAFERGVVPGTAALLVVLGAAALLADILRDPDLRRPRPLAAAALRDLGLPLALLALAHWLAPQRPGLWLALPLTLAIVALQGPLLYRAAFEPLAESSILVLLIAAVGVHFALVGLGLVFFGAEGYRTRPFSDAVLDLGPTVVSGQTLWIVGVTAALIGALYLFFERTLPGKALRATAVNRLGARLVGIPAARSGRIAFGLAAMIGALSGVLIAPATTIFYDTGFIIGLKGFVAAIIGGLSSYPAAAAAALFVGLVESFSSFWASAFKEVIVFTLIIPVLLLRSLSAHAVEDEE